MEIGVIVGLIVALIGILGGNILEGGSIGSLISPSAMLIIFGGTIGVTMFNVGLSNFLLIPKLIGEVLKKPKDNSHETVEALLSFAQKARREGLLALEEDIQEIQNKDPFMAKGLQMVVDGSDSSLVENVLLTEVELKEKRDIAGASVFEAAGGYAPTMGIIGTVMGLIHVLGNLENPDELGPAISVAFLATFWGIALANVFFLPIAGKLKGKAQEEAEMKHLVIEGILSIQKGDNPTVVREKLRAFLPAQKAAKPASSAAAMEASEEHA